MNSLAFGEYSILSKAFLTASSILTISSLETGLKSWVDGPCATIVNASKLFANMVGILEPPMSPRGPGWTQGLMNNALMLPSNLLKLATPTRVSIASPALSNNCSIVLVPSFICKMK